MELLIIIGFMYYCVGAVIAFHDFDPKTIGGMLAVFLLLAWAGPLVPVSDYLCTLLNIQIRK